MQTPRPKLPTELKMNQRVTVLLGCISVLGYAALGYCVERDAFGILLLCFAATFGAYALIIRQQAPLKTLIFWALAFRLVLLASTPALSDDYFRFVWDGRLAAAGMNPYLVLPSAFYSTALAQKLHLTELFSHLNSPQYYSVYPPLNQLIFGVSAWLSNGSLWANILLIRLFLLAAEAACFCILVYFKYPVRGLLLFYALNPLVVVELTGNLHFEGAMIGFLLVAFALLRRQMVWLSAVFMSLAVATKLLPLVFLPLVISKIGWRKGLAYGAVVGGINLVLFSPFFSQELLQNVASSINLYFQKFEFNASLYYLVRQVGYWYVGYNIIAKAGIALSVLALSGILLVSFVKSKWSFYQKAVFILTIYFACATTVHPWYVATLVALSSATNFRFPVVWTALLPLTYAAYSTQPYHENLWLVLLEYAVVGFVAYKEISINSKTPQHTAFET